MVRPVKPHRGSGVISRSNTQMIPVIEEAQTSDVALHRLCCVSDGGQALRRSETALQARQNQTAALLNRQHTTSLFDRLRSRGTQQHLTDLGFMYRSPLPYISDSVYRKSILPAAATS